MNILDLYFAAVSGNKIYKIKIKYLLKCPNEKEANKQTRLVKKLSSQTIDLTSAGQSIFYSDFRAMSILRTNVHTICNLNKTVRCPYVIILYVLIAKKLCQMLLTIIIFNSYLYDFIK